MRMTGYIITLLIGISLGMALMALRAQGAQIDQCARCPHIEDLASRVQGCIQATEPPAQEMDHSSIDDQVYEYPVPPLPSPRERPESPLLVVIDPGHGGRDPGATVGHLREKDINLAVAQRIHRALRLQGLPVSMTRLADRFVSLRERADAGVPPAQVLLSIHTDAAPHAQATGSTVFVSPNASPKALLFAGCIAAELAQLPIGARGIKPETFYLLHHTACPAVMVELGFLTHPEDRELLSCEEYQDRLAEAIARGVSEALQRLVASLGTKKGTTD